MASKSSGQYSPASSHRLRPRRSLGQHFLKDRAYLDTMLEAANVTPGDRVLEIGPGTGVLTQVLVDSGALVVAVELDERLADYLAATYDGRTDVRVVVGDILEMSPWETVSAAFPDERFQGSGGGYKVVANLPYYITSAILRHVLEAEPRPDRATVMVQREVAERICAQPGQMSLLAVSVQFYAEPQLVRIVPAVAFYPRPKVDSAILTLDVCGQPRVADVAPDTFFQVVRAGFAQRRKQVANSLSAALGVSKQEVRDALTANGIDPRRRAETFTLEEWRTICVALGRA